MGNSRPYPDEEDYKQTILHEYWHIYQHSKITDECTTDSRDKCERDKKLTGNCLGPLKLCHYLLTKGVTENGTETVFG